MGNCIEANQQQKPHPQLEVRDPKLTANNLFKLVNIMEFRKRIFKIKKDSFTYIDMRIQFEDIEEWTNPDIWKEGSDLEQLFNFYLPTKKTGGHACKTDIMALAILWCQGTKTEKAEVLFDMINYADLSQTINREAQPQERNQNCISNKSSNFIPVLNSIMEYAAIYSELNKRKVKTYTDEYIVEASNPIKYRAIKSMSFQSQEGDDGINGFLPELFGGDFQNKITMQKSQFIRKVVQDSKCSWIFSEQQIRKRLYNNFWTVAVQDQIEYRESILPQNNSTTTLNL